MQMIKVKDMGHSTVNLKEREADSKDPKSGLDNGQTQKQMAAFTRDILLGTPLAAFDPTTRGGWRLDSVFIVEPRPANDPHDKTYSVLSGSHRLSWLEGNVKTLRALAIAEKALVASSAGQAVTAHENASIAANAKADQWESFEVSCSIVHPADDDERRAIVAQGNADEPASDTKVKQADESKFPAFYGRAPKAEYMFQFDPLKTDVIRKVKGSESGWSSTEYQVKTGIGGNARVTYAALTRLGRHFDIPLSFFTGRLKIKPEVTPSLLVKETPLDKGSDRVKHLGYGLELRYITERAKAFGDNAKMEQVKADFKAEFLALMDESGDGSKALGNEPERTKEERDADKAKKAEVVEQAETAATSNLLTSRATYNFEKDVIARTTNASAPKLDACVGNAMDLLYIVSPSKYENEVNAAIAAFKERPTDETSIHAAIRALIVMLESTLPQTSIEHEEIAASSKHNTKKAKKS